MLSFYGMYLLYRYNAYLHPVVKMQEERGQSVVTTVPVREVPHVRYSLVLFPATALLLGSWLGLFLSPVLMALIISRTALEDRVLRDGLVGFAGSTRTLRCRLAPRVVNIDTKMAYKSVGKTNLGARGGLHRLAVFVRLLESLIGLRTPTSLLLPLQ
jgi:hypothetical protein